MNLYDLFASTARRQPHHPAIQGPGETDRQTYAQLNDSIVARADLLGQAGVQPGDCVGLHYASGAEYIALTYAIWRAGGCVVPIPVELAPVEKQQICREIALDHVISSPRTGSFAEPFRRAPSAAFLPSAILIPVHRQRDHPAEFHEVGAAFIRFTSGTTGDSRGVVLSHASVRERIGAVQELLGLGPDDRVLWLLSMSYHFTVSVVGYLSFGATVVLASHGFASDMIHSARFSSATMMYGSPIHYARLADSDGDARLPKLRLAISTATGLDPEVAERFHRRFGQPVNQALGIIEVGLPAINVDFAAEHPEAVGRVLPAYQLRMQDVGLGPGLKEILLKGPGFLDAYYEPWRPRRAILSEGWFRTGDVGELDEAGCLFIRGRSKEVINIGGMKFFPQEVESVLVLHPGIREACVRTKADSRFGELPCALVVVEEGLDSPPSQRELLELCKRNLAPFKIPLSIDFVDSLDRTASGKLLRRQTDMTPNR